MHLLAEFQTGPRNDVVRRSTGVIVNNAAFQTTTARCNYRPGVDSGRQMRGAILLLPGGRDTVRSELYTSKSSSAYDQSLRRR